MEKKTDLRVIKTYSALNNAFMDLIKEKDIEHITVNELCERALIRRTTFYTHFADKYEFITFFLKEYLQNNLPLTKIVKPNEPQEFYESVINNIFDNMELHKSLAISLRKSNMFAFLFELFSEQMVAELDDYYKELEEDGYTLPMDSIFLAHAITGGILQCTKYWVFQKEESSRETVTEQLMQLIMHINTFIK